MAAIPSRSLAAALAAAAALSGTPARAAGVTGAGVPPEAYLLPADSVVVFAADVHGFFASRLWSQVRSGELGSAAGLTPEKAAEMAREAEDGLEKGMSEMEAEVGFRADRDLDWVFFGMGNLDAPTPQAVGVAIGRFDAARILAAAEAGQAKSGGTLSRKQVGSVTVVTTVKNGKEDFSFAVPEPGQVVFGDRARVESVLAAREAGRRPLQTNTAVAKRLAALAPGTGLYFLAGEGATQKAAQGTPPPFPLPRSVALSVSLEGATELAAEMASVKDAEDAVSTLKQQMGLFAALLANDNDPQKAATGKLLSGLAVEAQGTSLRMSLSSDLAAGAVASIAVPSMLKARASANESAAIGDVRTVISAQAAYQSASRGVYGELACLGAPATCIKGYTGPQFLDKQLAALGVKDGYRRAFHPGPRAARARGLKTFAYTVVPVEQGKTGVRSFCGESSGVIRFDPKGGEITPVGGVCPATLEVLK